MTPGWKSRPARPRPRRRRRHGRFGHGQRTITIKELIPGAADRRPPIVSAATYEGHWAFRPPKPPPVPAVGERSWVRPPIDSFVLARPEKAGMRPAPEAPPHTLLRRLALDLTGLPPTVEEHDAFHTSMPFDRFTIESLAGDLLSDATVMQKVRSGFNRLHRTTEESGSDPEEFRVVYAIDRTNTTAATWMGVTFGCTQCHDHKYDPVSQREYYQLLAFFNSLRGEVPVSKEPSPPFVTVYSDADQRRLADLDREIAAAEQARARAAAAAGARFEEWLADPRAAPVLQPDALGGSVARAAGRSFFADTAIAPGLSCATPLRGRGSLVVVQADDSDAAVGHFAHAAAAPVLPGVGITIAEGPRVIPRFVSADGKPAGPPRRESFAADAGWKGVGNDAEGHDFGLRVGRLVRTLAAAAVERLRGPAAADLAPAQRAAIRDLYVERVAPQPAAEVQRIKALREERRDIAGLGGRAFVWKEDKPRPTHLLKQGDFLQPGERVERGVPAVFPPLAADAPRDRLALARWLLRDDHPLTARVAVIRSWKLVFGGGLVHTPGDSGTRGELPTHPELLDWLAVEFRTPSDGGRAWDIKRLVKLFVVSATYRQSSAVSRPARDRDPDNRLLGRGGRYRLAAEEIRDAALVSSGLLVRTVGGRSVYPYQPADFYAGKEEKKNAVRWPIERGPDLYRRGLDTAHT